ncbi:MAG TPA: hypothetical protein VKU77_09390 [Streptosporangiaceae bacterium]|nr:hypothetical protein [Streptosporangiaceae bacterium]
MTRGTWSGSGTFEVTGGGAHLVLLAVAALAVVSAAEWVLSRLLWLLGATAVVFAVAVTAVWWLIRRQQRREAAHAAMRTFVTARVQAVPLSSASRRELPAATHVHLHFGDDAEAARIIRTALPGQAGDAITGRN